MPALPPARGPLPEGCAREETRVSRRDVLGQARASLRSRGPTTRGGGSRHRRAWRESHREDLHGRLEWRLALSCALRAWLRESCGVGTCERRIVLVRNDRDVRGALRATGEPAERE